MKAAMILAVTSALVATCSAGSSQPSRPCAEGTPVRALYLTAPQPGISPNELASYPEVCVVADFEQLQSAPTSPVAIWIDQAVAHEVDVNWLQDPPQRYYPLVLVGYGTALYAFREHLGLPIGGPAVDWSLEAPKAGFSVWFIADETADSQSAIMEGYQEAPTARRILEITDELLDREPGRQTPIGSYPPE
jgi:hypothetical protein